MQHREKYGALTLKYKKDVFWVCACDCGKQNVYAKEEELLMKAFPSCGKCRREGKYAQEIAKIEAIKKAQRHHELIANSKAKRYQTRTSQGVFLSSKAEKEIYKLLTFAKIPFECEKDFEACYPNSNKPFRFDFYVENKYLIEYDGEQHFKSNTKYGGEDFLKRQQWRDWYKNEWCKKNGIPLIRIPYTKLSSLTIEDLRLETTKFRVV